MSCRLSPPLSVEREGQRSPRVVLDTILGTLDAVAVVNTADQLFTIRSFLSRNYCESFRPNVYLPFLSVIKRRKASFPSLLLLFLEFSREDAGNDRRVVVVVLDFWIASSIC